MGASMTNMYWTRMTPDHPTYGIWHNRDTGQLVIHLVGHDRVFTPEEFRELAMRIDDDVWRCTPT
jgi:hypothetical protein